MHFYRTYFKAFPFFAEVPPKLRSFSVMPYLFLLLTVYSSINQSSREIDVHVFIIKTTGQLSLSWFHSKKNNIIPYAASYLELFYPSVSLRKKSSSFFILIFPSGIRSPNPKIRTSLKQKAFAQVQPTVKAILSIPMEISKCSSKFCSEADKVKDAINMSYFMLHYFNIQHWAPSWSQFFSN